MYFNKDHYNNKFHFKVNMQLDMNGIKNLTIALDLECTTFYTIIS